MAEQVVYSEAHTFFLTVCYITSLEEEQGEMRGV